MIVIVILTASAIGIPAIWLIRRQFDSQAWAKVDQGSQTMKVLLDVHIKELNNVAILTAQRPTLAELLTQMDNAQLTAYLETLRAGADLDALMICDRQENEMVFKVGGEIPDRACQTGFTNPFFLSPPGSDIPGWFLASQPIPGYPRYAVVTGQALDTEFIGNLREQIGMDLLLFNKDTLVGGSIPGSQQFWETLPSQSAAPAPIEEKGTLEKFSLDNVDYYTARSRYGVTGLETIALLRGTAIAETQRQLTRPAAAGILFVTLFCSILAIMLTRRISQPLKKLRDSANALRMGDLSTPVLTTTRIQEIAEVTYALEDARIALRHSLEELRQEKTWGDYLLESVVEGIITIDRKDRITFFSQGAERITGWKQERVIGKVIDEVFRLADRESLFSQRIPLPGAKPEMVTILANERPLTISINGSRLAPPEAGKARLAISIRDVSNEEAMRGLLGNFLANITHEFRTPLTALAVSIELLLDQLPNLSLDETKQLLVSNHLGVLSLENLIDNLLEGASIEAGRFQVSPRPTELAEVIYEVVRIMQPLIDKNCHSLQTNLPGELPLVMADSRRTSQVLVNLLSNAIKWTPHRSEILISATATEDEVKVSIADRGPGIMPEHKQKLFLRFGQIQSFTPDGRAEYGAGLGLSVVKAIVESQNGQVGVEDREGGGAVFWFTIPIVKLDAEGEEDI